MGDRFEKYLLDANLGTMLINDSVANSYRQYLIYDTTVLKSSWPLPLLKAIFSLMSILYSQDIDYSSAAVCRSASMNYHTYALTVQRA